MLANREYAFTAIKIRELASLDLWVIRGCRRPRPINSAKALDELRHTAIQKASATVPDMANKRQTKIPVTMLKASQSAKKLIISSWHFEDQQSD